MSRISLAILFAGVVAIGVPASAQTGSPCDLTGNGVVNQNDVELAITRSLNGEPCSSGICVDGIYNVVAAQRVINASMGGTCLDTGGGTPHVVDLVWTASISPNVSGYNAYRGTSSGGPYNAKLNTGLITGTTFTDTTAEAGQTYYYVTTAVDGNNQESTYSNQAVAFVPSS